MENLTIESPCHEDWNEMTPMGNGRYCATCTNFVLDVTSLPVAVGREVIRELTTTCGHDRKPVCIRVQVTPNGRIVAGRRKLLTSALAGILASSVAGYAGEGPQVNPLPPDITVITESEPIDKDHNDHHEILLGKVVPRPSKEDTKPTTTPTPPIEPKPENKDDTSEF